MEHPELYKQMLSLYYVKKGVHRTLKFPDNWKSVEGMLVSLGVIFETDEPHKEWPPHKVVYFAKYGYVDPEDMEKQVKESDSLWIKVALRGYKVLETELHNFELEFFNQLERK